VQWLIFCLLSFLQNKSYCSKSFILFSLTMLLIQVSTYCGITYVLCYRNSYSCTSNMFWLTINTITVYLINIFFSKLYIVVKYCFFSCQAYTVTENGRIYLGNITTNIAYIPYFKTFFYFHQYFQIVTFNLPSIILYCITFIQGVMLQYLCTI